MKATAKQVMADLLAEIEAAEQAALEGHLDDQQLAWIEEAKAEFRRLEARLGEERS